VAAASTAAAATDMVGKSSAGPETWNSLTEKRVEKTGLKVDTRSEFCRERAHTLAAVQKGARFGFCRDTNSLKPGAREARCGYCRGRDSF